MGTPKQHPMRRVWAVSGRYAECDGLAYPGLRAGAYTLVEMVLVIGIMVALTALAVPSFYAHFRRDRLPDSARQMRSLIALTRAHASLDGKRYRIRFPRKDEGELDSLGTKRQPIIEREDDPLHAPEVFGPVRASWVVGETLRGEVWCAEVRRGRPTIEKLRERRSQIEDRLERALREFEPERPPYGIDIDGTSDWATFVLTEAPRDTDLEDLIDHPTIEVITDGLTGRTWLQRPLYDEELDLFEDKGWPAVLGQDYLDPTVITEDRVLELREFRISS